MPYGEDRPFPCRKPLLKPPREPALALGRALLHVLVKAVHCGSKVFSNFLSCGVKLLLCGGAVALQFAVNLVGCVLGLLSLLFYAISMRGRAVDGKERSTMLLTALSNFWPASSALNFTPVFASFCSPGMSWRILLESFAASSASRQ
jgi:hypothetical protein